MTSPVSSQGTQIPPAGAEGVGTCGTPRNGAAGRAPEAVKARLEVHGQSLLGALLGGPIPGLGLLFGGSQGWSLSVEIDRPFAVAPHPGGYCRAPPRPDDGDLGKKGGGGGAGGKAKGDLAFLDDKSLPIEEKLFRFMLLMQKKADKELEDFMRASAPGGEGGAKAGETKAGGTSSKRDGGGGGLLGGLLGGGGGGGLLGGLLGGGGGIVGGLFGGGGGGFVGGLLGGGGGLLGGLFGGEGGGLGSILGDDGIKKAVGSLGGPLLAAATSAIGLPMLAPIASKVGGALGEVVVDQIAGGGAKGSGGSAGTGKAGAGGAAGGKTGSGSAEKSDGKGTQAMSDQERMLRLQHLLETQQKMFSAISNAMKSLHDTQMTAIHNFR